MKIKHLRHPTGPDRFVVTLSERNLRRLTELWEQWKAGKVQPPVQARLVYPADGDPVELFVAIEDDDTHYADRAEELARWGDGR